MHALMNLLGVSELPQGERSIIIINLVMAVVNLVLHLVRKNNPKL